MARVPCPPAASLQLSVGRVSCPCIEWGACRMGGCVLHPAPWLRRHLLSVVHSNCSMDSWEQPLCPWPGACRQHIV